MFFKLGIICLLFGLFATVSGQKSLFYENKAITNYNLYQETPTIECTSDFDCNHGTCMIDPNNSTRNFCECDDRYVSRDGEICNYEQKEILVAFLLAFFVGCTGAQWYYLAAGSGTYIFLGVCQCLTCHFCIIGGIIVWIAILAGIVPDGNGVDLAPFRES